MKKLLYAAGVLAVGVAYFIGFWPQYQQLAQARNDLRAADRELADLRCRMRITRLEHILLEALERAARQSYAEAGESVRQFSLELSAQVARPDMKAFEPRLKPLMARVEEIERALQEKNQMAARDAIRGLVRDLNEIVVPPAPADLPVMLRTPTGQTP
jgi:type II secretory pathway component PulM